jgi:hypothetical protein
MRSEQGCFVSAVLRLVIILSAAIVFLHGRRAEED